MDLETARQILTGKLSRIGSSRLKRDAFAEILGYSSAGGGIAARKVSALLQYGLIDYRDGLYELSTRGYRLQTLEVGSQEFLKAARVALEKPALFRSLLSQYRPLGRIPEDLAKVLTRQYGITDRASEDAEEVFIRSAVFAGVLDKESCFLEAPQVLIPVAQTSASSAQHQVRAERRSPFFLPVSEGRAAGLNLPLNMSAKDLEILEKRLRFELENGTLWEYLGLKKMGTKPAQVQHQVMPERKSPFLLALSEGRAAALDLPLDMSAKDLEILEKRLRFEIENGTLWEYLSLKTLGTKPAHGFLEQQDPMEADNVVPIRPVRET